MLAHKLTSAVFPQSDKLIRNLMGILTESQVGNSSTFPMCGFSADEWVLALMELKALIPLAELGPDHESWGMKDEGGGRLRIFDKAKQHTAYAETGSFANYLWHTFGIKKIKQLQRFSQEKERPFQEVFGSTLQELEKNWLASLRKDDRISVERVQTLKKLFENDPQTACSAAQAL